jgi:hypothetical protein
MSQNFNIPEEYEIPFRRILPYLSAQLQKDPEIIESLVLYFKFGGEKMTRIAIDALNATHRIEQAELLKRLREAAMLADSVNEDDGEDDEDESDDDNGNDDNI